MIVIDEFEIIEIQVGLTVHYTLLLYLLNVMQSDHSCLTDYSYSCFVNESRDTGYQVLRSLQRGLAYPTHQNSQAL